MILVTLALLLTQEVNPRYELWASHKPESWVKQKMVIKTGQMDITTEIVTKLLEVTGEKVVVEITTKSKIGEREMAQPPRKEEITKKPDPSKPMKAAGESEEEVRVGGKTLKCKVYEFEMDTPGGTSKGKSWVSKEIPGGVAKSEFTSEKMPAPMKLEAVEWEKK